MRPQWPESMCLACFPTGPAHPGSPPSPAREGPLKGGIISSPHYLSPPHHHSTRAHTQHDPLNSACSSLHATCCSPHRAGHGLQKPDPGWTLALAESWLKLLLPCRGGRTEALRGRSPRERVPPTTPSCSNLPPGRSLPEPFYNSCGGNYLH